MSERKPPKYPSLVQLSTVDPVEVLALWDPYILEGKVNLVDGDPGLGKTHLALTIASAVTTGGALPDKSGRPAQHVPFGRVLYFTAEDGLDDTLRPRIDAAGGNPENIWCLPMGRHLTLAQHMPAIEHYVAEHTPKLVIFDPMMYYLGDKVDAHRSNETRPLLSKLGEIATRHRFAVLGIRHLKKGESRSAAMAGLGSVDISAAARSVLLVAADPEDSNRSLMAHSKSNLRKKGPTLAFEIRDGVFYWCSRGSELSADDLVRASNRAGSGRPDDKKQSAIGWLEDLLSDGPVRSTKVLAEAERSEISEKTVRRAKKELGVTVLRDGSAWYWALKDDPRWPEGVANLPTEGD